MGKCFYYYVDSTGNMKSVVVFADALEICKGKNATVFEPNSREDGETMIKFVKEKTSGSYPYMWINYRDIVDQASFVRCKQLSVCLLILYGEPVHDGSNPS